jgi:uncharacterized protein YegL
MTDQVPFSADQAPFGGEDFAINPEPRCPVVLLLDTSGSMQGRPIQELNEGLVTFKDELMADELAAKRVELAIVSFGPVQVVTDFQTADIFHPPTLEANSDTPMGAAVIQALSMLESRKSMYRAHGVSFYRPWIFLITDGAPTDSWQTAAAMAREGETAKKYAFFAVGVEGARMDILGQFTTREPLKLQGLKFRSLFQWLSNSMKAVSRSQPADAVPLQDPTQGPTGWATV